MLRSLVGSEMCIRDSITTSAENRALCLEIINFAQIFNMKIIAEGIENQEQAELLAKGGCDFGQGYFYSKPLPADQFEELLKAQPFVIHKEPQPLDESVDICA